jgi:hypothetical protein
MFKFYAYTKLAFLLVPGNHLAGCYMHGCISLLDVDWGCSMFDSACIVVFCFLGAT